MARMLSVVQAIQPEAKSPLVVASSLLEVALFDAASWPINEGISCTPMVKSGRRRCAGADGWRRSITDRDTFERMEISYTGIWVRQISSRGGNETHAPKLHTSCTGTCVEMSMRFLRRAARWIGNIKGPNVSSRLVRLHAGCIGESLWPGDINAMRSEEDLFLVWPFPV
jgi:hypothetical protein